MENKRTFKNTIQRCGSDKILPLAIVYMFYIILHGHLSPGGGFQGGVLMVAIVVLLYFGHGYETTVRAINPHFLHGAEGFMSVLYVAAAMFGIAYLGNFCQNVFYNIGNIGDLFSSGTIFWMNVTVGVKVITGIGSISLLMISLLAGKDIDTTE